MNTTKLKNVCVVVSGTTPKSTDKRYWNGTHVWITPAELSEDSFIVTDSERHITDEAIKATGLKSFPKGTVLLSSRAPIGKVAIAGCEMYCNQGFKNLICSESIYNLYLYYFLKSKTAYLNSLGRGATFKEISKGIVEDISIPFPVYSEQIRIAKQLQKISELISLKKGQYRYFDDIIRSRFLELFGDPNDVSILSLPGEKKSIEDVCDGIYGGGTPSKSHKEYYTGKIPWVTPKDMKTLSIDDSQNHINSEAIENSTAKLIPKRCVLMVIRSGILKHTLPVAINNVEVTINQDMKAFVPSSLITPEYLLYTFKLMEKSILSKVRGVTADNIEFSEFRKRRIVVPPIEVQTQFVDFALSIDKSKMAVQKSLDELETLKKSLMQTYFG